MRLSCKQGHSHRGHFHSTPAERTPRGRRPRRDKTDRPTAAPNRKTTAPRKRCRRRRAAPPHGRDHRSDPNQLVSAPAPPHSQIRGSQIPSPFRHPPCRATRLAMADCRSLIEFLRAFEQHRRRASSSDASSPRPRRASLSSSSSSSTTTASRSRSRGRLFPALCDHSALAAVDALALLASLAALAFLAAPYARLLAVEARDAVATVATRHPAAPPRCRGLRKAVEYDIQLETEECVRGLLPLSHGVGGGAAATWPVAGLGDEHRELEAVLRKMAPPNGRTVLIFRAPCGCPKERVEVWGAKKVRRMKK
ncbi:hypothetical protein SORBI_3009G177901 [Sorghum bicolor]|uniref:Ribosomal protein L34e superfamily protein n=1 Tax=Sorghum bicolor TaxID=4558 RepID=A0A1Z5R393_SORBI|nr:hypothetical protein SORBI_3009G177901 [Sorghum bicolor]OQU78216.1 hypothetical protein SORBI_3009G177901 [Sorghum bicolor]OQU78217.1 hypothetical protein SORBI_3009G177901 [Sorghum bicolor]